METDFEKAYKAFVDEQAYDPSADAYFPIMRASFKAGWIAAGGKDPALKADGTLPVHISR